ncbi:MAG: hypothetical protein IAI49_04665 [Candidatus Eremiobacteraeota bacterium]|nr:hypothetical protein [Candidatus Eremiobacteraeota bacterium]
MPFADLADRERAEQFGLLRVELFFEDEALREDDAVALVIEIDHLEAQVLAHELFEISDRLAADLRGRNEAAHAEIDEDAALDHLRDGRFDHFVVLVRRNHFFPRLERAGAAFAEEQRAFFVDPVDHDFELVADFEFFRLDRERKLAEA